jgi:hypothetical protein
LIRKFFIAAAVILLVTATAGVAKMAGLLSGSAPPAAASGISETASAAHMAAETRYEMAEKERLAAAKAAEERERTPREMFTKLFPGEDYDETLDVLAKVLRGEASGVKSDTNKACVIWCVLNRVDVQMRGETIIQCAKSMHQFNYHKRTPVVDSFRAIAEDVLTRWMREKMGDTDVGRVLPADYCFFYGNGRYNVFRDQYVISGSEKLMPVHSEVYQD